MKKQIKKTGDFGTGLLIHIVHMGDDAQAIRDFYRRVFGGYVFMGVDEISYFDQEDRFAALVMVGDLSIEAMAPALPANTAYPVGKFFTKFGRHLHSVGYEVDDLAGLANRMIDRGIYVAKPGGGRLEKLEPDTGYFFPSPRDTAGLMVQMTLPGVVTDPRADDTWSSLAGMWQHHPLTLERFSHTTLGVRDLEAAVAVYVDTMQAVPINEGVDDALGARYALLQLGDSLLQVAQPTDATSDLGRHVEQWGNMIYSLHFKIADADRAEDWLNQNDVRTTRLRPGLIATNPEDCFGAPMFLSTEKIDGDPFGD